MILSRNDYEALYEEVKFVNGENVEGKFYVADIQELKEQALSYLKIKCDYYDEELEDIEFDLRWKGEGLYCFWALELISDYTVAHIVEIFEAETQVNHKVFLGDQETIKKEKEAFQCHEDSPWLDYTVEEINEMDYEKFYEFLRLYNWELMR